jgi:DNA-binding MarR family transcriptional regulator
LHCHVRRVADPADRRRVLIELTPERPRLAMKLYGPIIQAAEGLSNNSDSELRDFARYFQNRQAERIRALPPPAD